MGGVFTDYEQKTLSLLYYFEEKAGIEATKQIMDYQWLADSVTAKELELLMKLEDLVLDNAEAARQISLGTLAPYLLGLISESVGQAPDYPWLADGVNMQKLSAVIGIGRLAKQAPDLADRLLGYSWLADGASERESDGIDRLAHLARRDLELARQVVGMGILDDPLRDRGLHAITSLSRFVGTDDMTLLVNQPWFVDGLTDEETAFLAVTNRDKQSDAAQRWVGEGNHRGVVYHETAHYYYMGVHVWFNEGYADLVVTYTMVQEGLRDLAERIAYLEEYDLPDCVEQGYRNIQELLDKGGPPCLGELFLDSLLELLGEEAMSASLRELYLMRTEGGEPTEEDVYRIFLKHTPDGLEDEFRDLYKRLHGGPYADADT